MRKSRILAGCILSTFSILPNLAFAINVEDLMRHIDRTWRSDTSHAVMEMQVKTKRYQRTMSMESWSKGQEKSLVIIRSPRKDRGIATLKVENNIWNYLPKINRVTKVPPSMMSGSWMGSHFTNDDLVQESTWENDFSSAITFEGFRDGRQIYEVTSTPNEDAAVVWGKVVNIIDMQGLYPIRADYFDEEGNKIRTMTLSNIKQMGKRFVPMKMTLIPEEKPDEATIVIYKMIEYDLPVNDNIFSLQSLRRAH